MLEIRPLCILVSIVFLVLLAPPVNAEEIERLDSDIEGVQLIIYRIIEVDFENTKNTVYYQTTEDVNWTLSSRLKSLEISGIWNLNIERNGEQILFIPRPDIEQIGEEYFYKYNLYTNESALFKISFERKNVEEIVSKYLYPFDRYFIHAQQNITESVSTTTAFSFPKVDIIVEPSSKIQADFEHPLVPYPLTLQAKESLHNVFVTHEMVLINGEIKGMGVILIGGPDYEEIVLPKPKTDLITHTIDISFGRTIFPSQFLFFVLAGYTVWVTLFWIRKERRSYSKIFYKIYVVTALPLIVAEFTISFLPPSRPLVPTLFDSIILWPLIMVLIPSTVAKVKNSIKGKFSKNSASKKLEQELKGIGIDILERRDGLVLELVINKLPPSIEPKPKGKMRKYFGELPSFFVKDCDRGKYAESGTDINTLVPLEELKTEIEKYFEFKNKIPIVEKIAILHLEKFNQNNVFLVEKKLDIYDEETLEKMGFLEDAKKLIGKANYICKPPNEFVLKNIGYDKWEKKLKFFDVFPR